MKFSDVHLDKSVWKWVEGGIAAPAGFRAAGVMAGVKYADKYDVAIIYSEVPAKAAGVYTRNKVKAHPLLLTRQNLSDGMAQAIVVNSGNANACVGQAGDEAALLMAEKTAQMLGLKPVDVAVASTGVIGVEMPKVTVVRGIEQAAQLVLEAKNDDGKALGELAHQAALAIMTTDTVVKEVALEFECSRGNIRIGAIAKGSGMIHPNMGTMLGFITTDAGIASDKLQDLLRKAVDDSFNMVTVDGDTSTNDMVILLANGLSGIELEGNDLEAFATMLNLICQTLAKIIARDGEGATKFLEVKVDGARSQEDARMIAKSVCGSSLVKSALYGEDANWGRILCAAGYSGGEFNPELLDIYLGNVLVAQNGQGVNFSEEEAKAVLSQKEVTFRLILQEGEAQATAWGCDLTHDYVTINGSYRS